MTRPVKLESKLPCKNHLLLGYGEKLWTLLLLESMLRKKKSVGNII